MYIKKYKIEIILFVVNSIYMILELIASRLLSPYFGSSNIVWTSIIGIILLSTSIGNYVGGIIADKAKNNNSVLKNNIRIILIITGILIYIIPIFQQIVIETLTVWIESIKIGAIVTTTIFFFLPSMFIGILSPIIIKLKMNDLENVGTTSGRIYALATLGSIVGTFLGGFLLIPNFGSNEILFVLSSIQFLLLLFIEDEEKQNKKLMIGLIIIVAVIINIISFIVFYNSNKQNERKVKNGEIGVVVNYDTQYGSVRIYNTETTEGIVRQLSIDKGNESATYIDKDKYNELVYEYTKYYDLMFNSSRNIDNVLMIGGAGYSYPKYFLGKYKSKKIDVVEIDEKVTEIANDFFYLDKLKLEDKYRFKNVNQDGRIYLNKNKKKYDAILNDSFSGEIPAKTLTTKEAVEKIYNSLNKNGIYLTNIISSLKGENSKFIQSELKTLKGVFKNVYVVPCNFKDNYDKIQNNMVIATDENLKIQGDVNINYEEGMILTDNYNPIEILIPKR